jgi:hypothetical protein
MPPPGSRGTICGVRRKGPSPVIPAGVTLVFDVELIEIVGGPKSTASSSPKGQP